MNREKEKKDDQDRKMSCADELKFGLHALFAQNDAAEAKKKAAAEERTDADKS